ncbi:hypothetical protein X011_20990 [Mycobacterium tuberculosis variant microti OV254]|nr:hypothetical protein X011_20990 [Mycobacterium tuberculosis variant microti OV254]BBX39356.1 hypothetical protein MSIM_08070 [Mycobacterium simiae]
MIAVAIPWTPSGLGDLTGKRILVTGATSGVGLGTARAPAARPVAVAAEQTRTKLEV